MNKLIALGACTVASLTWGTAQARDFDFSASVGTDGIGLDLSTKVTEWVGVRTGISFVPRFDYNMKFGVEMYDDASTSEELQSRFESMAKRLQEMTGIEIQDHVTMVGHPNFVNWKLLFDFRPIPQDRRWTVTAGFYLGAATVAKAENSIQDASTLLGVSIYNNMYEKACNDEPVLTLGSTPLYMPQLASYGRMGMNVGSYADGSVYLMEPDANSTVSARVKVNRFKPYLGLGFGDALGKEQRFHYNVDLGAMFWGGTPSVVTHDGTDLTRLSTVHGRPGDYVDVVKKFKVYPVVGIRFSYTLFRY
jgi:hypothetical protein